MVKLRKLDTVILVCTLVFIAIAMYIRYISRITIGSGSWLVLLRSSIYIIMVSLWGFSIRKRIVQSQVRDYLIAISVLMVLWLSFRTIKYTINNPVVEHFLWYLYYLAMLFIPLFALFVAASLGKPDDFRLPGGMMLMYIPTALLFLLVITNDLHQLVFIFPSGVFSDSDYSYNAGFYDILAWEAFCAGGSLCIIFSKCRIPYSKTFLSLPLLPFGLLIIYCIASIKKVYWVWLLAGDITVSICLFVMATFESCIQCGLIPSNIGYNELLDATTIRAQLVDKDFNLYRRSANASDISKENLQNAAGGTVQLDRNTLLRGSPISGGYIFWQVDISEIVEATEELISVQDELRDVGDILKAENEQQALQLHLIEENRLYSLVEERVSHQLKILKGLLERLKQSGDIDEARKILGQIVIIGTYVKRRSNLVFVVGQKHAVSSEELRLCLNESVSGLKLYGVGCRTEIHFNGAQPPSEKVIMIYDLFEAVIEAGLNSLSSLLLFAESNGETLSVNISAACDEDISELRERFPSLEIERDDDGIWCLSLSEVTA